MLKKLRHIAIMVDGFEEAINQFKGFGLECSEIKEDKRIDLLAGFLSIGDTSIEVLHHTKPDTGDDPVSTVVRGQKGAVNHLCFEVDDLDASIRDFERNGAKRIEGCPRPGAHGRIAFFYPETTSGVLIELCEL
ncbi:MAG: VOC family protein [Acidobacteria bacterium]|nr:VOC family protein [Acidobacteriota bacterium]